MQASLVVVKIVDEIQCPYTGLDEPQDEYHAARP